MVRGNAAFGHIRCNDRHLHHFGEFNAKIRGVGQDDTSPHDESRCFCFIDHSDCFLDFFFVRVRVVIGQRLVVFHIIVDFCHLDVQRQVHQHGARFSGLCQHKGFLHDINNRIGLGYAKCSFCDRFANFGNIDALEGIFAELGGDGLPGDRQQGNGINVGGVDSSDKIRCAGTRSAKSYSHFAAGPVIAIGRMYGGFLVTHAVVFDAGQTKLLIYGIYPCARNPKGIRNTFLFQYLDDNF